MGIDANDLLRNFMSKRLIFHIDVNSAFLSWTAAYRVMVLGEKEDLRQVPSVICGDIESRHGIILAKSVPAKAFDIQTGEPLFQAMRKCPNLKVAEPDYGIYVQASRQFIQTLREMAPTVEQYSIDEAWADFSGTSSLYGSPVETAMILKEKIKKELGFTVNIGISSNKLLAKMAGDFEKPDKIHTLFPEEMPQKLWPLGVRDLFSVGAATEKKLRIYGIKTIGDLARADVLFLREKLGKNGESIWNLANGRDVSPVRTGQVANKGYGNSTTTAMDVTDYKTAHRILLSLCETVAMRMRQDGQNGRCMMVHIRNQQFVDESHQRTMTSSTNVTEELYREACLVLRELWREDTPLRQLGVQVSNLSQGDGYRQFSLFDGGKYDRMEKMDATVDEIRRKFGEQSLFRARFLDNKEQHMAGGLDKERRTGVTQKEV